MNRVLARAATITALALVAGCGDDDPTGPTAITIVSPATVTPLSGGVDSRKLYRIVVPSTATRLTVTTSGGTGDVDLFVHGGSTPPAFGADCDSFEPGTNAESCVIDDADLEAGNYFILLIGSTPYSNVTLTATVTIPT
jgi:hypothetical protein